MNTKLNLNAMTKAEILELWNHRCSHGRNGIAHHKCFLEEKRIEERVGFLDIEASNLKANFGIILSWAIKPAHSDTVIYDCVTKRDLQGDLDKRIVETLFATIDNDFDRLVGHYSTKFDIPYIRTRALIHGLDDIVPLFGEKLHSDTYYMARSKLCLHSNRQGAIGDALTGQDIKTKIDHGHWLRGLQGNQKSLDYILDHNIKDVYQLEGNYNKLKPYVKLNNRSM